VVGVDISEPMIRFGRLRCADKPWVRFEMGEATQLPFPDGVFDAAISVQVYEYVREVDAALAEMFRVLRPGGRAAVVSTDWKYNHLALERRGPNGKDSRGLRRTLRLRRPAPHPWGEAEIRRIQRQPRSGHHAISSKQ
jgi:ubiquinone/menaquinone biosynthesis C-methylase UbiE